MRIDLPDVDRAWGHINLFAECGPLSEGGLLDIEPLLSKDTLDAIIREAGPAMVQHYRETWQRVAGQSMECTRRQQEERDAKRLARMRDLNGGDDPVCVACGRPDDLTIDHILPRSRGGTDAKSNLQVLCRGCNSSKGARTMAEWVGAQS